MTRGWSRCVTSCQLNLLTVTLLVLTTVHAFCLQHCIPLMRKWFADKVDGGTECEFIRSDGAGSHFKNKYTMRWLACNRGNLKRSTW